MKHLFGAIRPPWRFAVDVGSHWKHDVGPCNSPGNGQVGTFSGTPPATSELGQIDRKNHEIYDFCSAYVGPQRKQTDRDRNATWFPESLCSVALSPLIPKMKSGESGMPSNGKIGGDRFPTPIPTAPQIDFAYEAITQIERIGRGGNADVYKARVRTDGSEYIVDVKEPRFQQATLHAGVIERFLNEAQTWANLDSHDHIVDVIEWGSAPLPWIALEYMDGGSLRERIEDIDVNEALRVGIDTANAIRYAHRHGVVHLDLKPENILFSQTVSEYWDVPKVSDWGLARLMLDQSQSVEGISPRYAAPEQFDPETYGTPDDFTDIYQLGVVMYEVLTGDPPFTGSATAVMRATLEESPTPPTSKRPDLPVATDEILETALAKRKANRYESILDFRRALEDVVAAVDSASGPNHGEAKDVPPKKSRGDRLQADAEDLHDAGNYDRAIRLYDRAHEAYEDALAKASKYERLDADEIHRSIEEVKEGLRSARRQQLREEVDLLRSRIEHAATLLEEDGDGPAKDELEPLRSRISTVKRNTAEHGFDDLQNEVTSLEQRFGELYEEDEPDEGSTEPSAMPRPDRRTLLKTGGGLVVLAGVGVAATRDYSDPGGSGSNADTGGGGSNAVAGGGSPIPIGSILPRTGNLSQYGADMHEGLRLAVEQVNDAEGPLGREIELFSRDSGSVAQIAQEQYSELVQEQRIVGFVGAASSGVSVSLAQRIADDQVMEVSPASTSPMLADLGYGGDTKYFGRTAPNDGQQGVVMALVLDEFVEADSAAFLHINNEYGKGLAQRAAQEFNGETFRLTPYSPQTADFTSTLEQLFKGNPDAIGFVGYPEGGYSILKTWQDGGYGGQWVLSGGLNSPDLLQTIPNIVEGMYVSSPDPEETKGAKQFANDLGHAPGWFSAHSYDALFLMALAIHKAGEVSGTAIAENIRAVSRQPGETVTVGQFQEAKNLLDDGIAINYEGASSPVDLNEALEPLTRFAILQIQADGSTENISQIPRSFFEG